MNVHGATGWISVPLSSAMRTVVFQMNSLAFYGENLCKYFENGISKKPIKVYSGRLMFNSG